VRLETSDPAVWAHGVIAADQRSALFAHVQLDESTHNRGVVLQLPGLDPERRYECAWVGPVDRARVSGAAALNPAGPTGGVALSGAALATVGIWLPRRRPEQVQLFAVEATG
jgi:alpha-galactosidase